MGMAAKGHAFMALGNPLTVMQPGDQKGPIVENVAERLGLEEKQAAFHAALMGEDELGAVVRAHIHIEHELIEFIRARLSPPDALDAISLDYSGRVKLAIALGLPKEMQAPLNFIGTLRNRFAHRLDARLSEHEANNFAKALAPGEQEIFEKSYFEAYKKAEKRKLFPKINELNPKDRITLYFVLLWSAIAVYAIKASEAGEENI